ncbi:hypothetical protein [Pelagovum pacificum]|uniref:Pilus assembly protein n=1 Tax=Pelagovum pacificum TaxID=2588711 RepID=A0A5C5GAC6_9RHOB|nr:hypothetical protein [Pelagovum pacificum]QQA41642.1 hypothetical protein I8N54_12530 [Pelagovum pacificum]TNY30920.1 hypothetical protein FHY64_17605 [Pelagovum pacificum]
MLRLLTRLKLDEKGAVTIDWVVLTAAIIGLSLALIAAIAGGATDTSTGVGARLSKQTLLAW